jgi:hypothetical protein
MANPYIPVRTEDVPLGHTGDVSPMEETTTSPLRQPSVTPQKENSEKQTAITLTDESLNSQSSPQNFLHITVRIIKVTNYLALEFSMYHDSSYPILSKESQANLGKQYQATKQLQMLLYRGFLRWFVTAGLLGLLGITIWKYSTYRIISNDERLWFNAIMTGLSIVIGLAVASSLNAMTFNVRWWLLSLRKRPLRHVRDSSVCYCLQLLLTSLNRWRQSSKVIYWILNRISWTHG